MSLKFGVHDVIVLFLFATMGFHIARLGFFGPQRSCYKGSLLYNQDVVGAAPTGDAPTTSELSTITLPKVRLILEV